MPRLLHVGCGPKRKGATVRAFAAADWEEVTLDIDAAVAPDIIDKLPELLQVADRSFDAIYSAHNIEHLYPHEVDIALKSFLRVLKDDGFAIVTCPDLQILGERLASGDIDTPIYRSSLGPVSPIDMLYGFRRSMREGNLFMAHHTGFTLKSLETACIKAGFYGFAGFRRPNELDLWGLAIKAKMTKAQLREMAAIYLKPL